MMSADIAWLKSEIAHCRRMEYVAEAQRFERILNAIAGEAGTAETGNTDSARRASTRAEGIAQKDAA